MKTRTHRGRFGLAGVICIAILVTCLIVAVFISIENRSKYLEAVYQTYSDEAHGAARTIEHSIDAAEWERYATVVISAHAGEIGPDALSQDADYLAAKSKVQTLVDDFEIGNVSVFTIDFDTMNSVAEQDFTLENSDVLISIFDLYPSNRDRTAKDSGDYALWWKNYEDFCDYRELLNELADDGYNIAWLEKTEDGGTTVTEYYPIMNGSDFVAIIRVSFDASKIETFVNTFFNETFLQAGIAALLLSLAAMVFFWLRIVRPLRLITHEADRFIDNNAEVSEKLSTVHTHDEIQTLSESFLCMEKDIRGYVDRVTKVTADRERISTELSIATNIQEGMLPSTFPAFPDRPEFDIYATMTPAREVGGDFYDFFLIDQNHLALVIADASGKGVPASLFMVITKVLIKNRAMMGGTPAQILKDVNRQLCDGNDTGMFATVWFAIIDLRTGSGLSVNAGHEHPIYREAGKAYKLIKYRHSIALGVAETAVFREREFDMKPGDRIFVYTDGLPESTDDSNTLYGSDRVLEKLNAHPDADLPDLLRIMKEDALQFTGTADQFDDLTMLIFEYKGPEAYDGHKQI